MAAVNSSPMGFSYAQAARGHTSATISQTPSSKVTSGVAAPATGTFSELTPGSNWADDVEATVGEKTVVPQKTQQEERKSSQPKESVVEHAKSEDKTKEGVSNTSSPDLTASSSTTTKEDDASSTPNGTSSESTWDTKSQTSEPAWIAERKERQDSSQSSEKTVKGDEKSKEAAIVTPPKSVVLQEAPPPAVNPWLKRQEDAKVKTAPLPKPAQTTPTSASSNLKENQRPQADTRQKSNSVTSTPREPLTSSSDETRKPNGSQGRRTNDVRNGGSRQSSKAATDDARTDSPLASSARATPTERQSDPTISAPPPSMKDQVSWPTPDSAQEKDRKEAPEKTPEERHEEDATPTTKRKKNEWKQMAVVPNYLFDTPSSELKGAKPRGAPNGERTSRGGNAGRGRGGHRGTTNGGERPTSRSISAPNNQDADSSVAQRAASGPADRETMAPPPRPNRASSASPRSEQKKDPGSDRTTRGQSFTETTPSEKTTSDAAKTPNFSQPFSEGRRTKSPKKMSADKDEEDVPKPILRRNSIGTQTVAPTAGSDSTTRERPPIRMIPSDGRKETRNIDTARDPAWIPPRGGKRGGRGRGGNGARELSNGHSAAHTYGNNYAPDFSAAPPYGVPSSPSTYQSTRGNHQFTYPPPGRGGWRANPRSQSTPFENYYNQRYPGQFAGGQPAMAPLQTFVPGVYDPNGYPMSAIPYSPHMETQQLMNMVTIQLEYYFSMDNLLKDMFLRKHMDSQGFVFLDVIANFNRIKQLTPDKDLIKIVCINSEHIEIRVGEDGKERLRKREGWEQFLLPLEQREQSAQTQGPAQLERPERPQLVMNNISPPFRGPASAGLPHMHQQRFDRRSYDSSYPSPMANGYPTQFAAYPGYAEAAYPPEMANGEEMRGRAAKSPIHESNMPSPSEETLVGTPEMSESEPEAFPDEQAAVLTVVVRTSEQRAPFHNAASRTFSNGSIDSRSVFPEIQKPADSKPQTSTNGETLVNGSENANKLNLSRQVSPNKAHPNERAPGILWVKNQDWPLENLPEDLTPVPYEHLRQKAMTERREAATGNCPYDLDVLYQFWCHFLLRNFNSRMYTEFKSMANEDATQRLNVTGLQNLLQFYSKSLASNNPIRERVVKDYVELVKNEPSKLEGMAFKQLRSAWRNGALNLKNRKKLADILDEQLKESLDRVDS